MKRIIFNIICALGAFGAVTVTSCSDIMDTDSEQVEFIEDTHINSRQDTAYSVMGVLAKIQALADRTIMLGEARGDLITVTDKASSDLKALAGFSLSADTANRFNQISDYYAVINNCNLYLSKVDTLLAKNGRKVFEGETAYIHIFRAWAYLQAVLAYGEVPLVTTPVLTEKEAQQQMNQPFSDIKAVCNYFINDLQPYIDVTLPDYGQLGSVSTLKFYTVRLLLGDLCLWAERYQEAAQYYHDYLTNVNDLHPLGTNQVVWNSNSRDFLTNTVSNSYSSVFNFSGETVATIPVETQPYYGVTSELRDIYNSTSENYGYYQATASAALRQLSAAQDYCMLYRVSSTRYDTVYVPKTGLSRSDWAGDLRFATVFSSSHINVDANSRTHDYRQSISKFNINYINFYRLSMVYLRFAEALNRAGYPQSAFAVLKYGLYEDAINNNIDEVERTAAGTLLAFNSNYFNEYNTIGIHSRGSGDTQGNAHYVLPQPDVQLPTRRDTVDYQIPLVEDYIINEMALEGAFEGYRFYDLMRVALRRGDNDYLARPVSLRNGTQDAALYSRLMDRSQWYLPVKK